nr:glycoside hydrolase family 3 C-terminal domain-containing protein [Butyrivibrio sp.]
MGLIFASKSNEIEERERIHGEISRKLAGECVVLLENDGTLPLKSDKKVALFGNAVRNTVRGGTGSGDVNTRDNVTIEQGAEHAGLSIVSGDFLDRQDEALKIAKNKYFEECTREANEKGVPVFTVMFDNPFKEPEPLAITENDIDTDLTDTAIYCVSRNSGEGADRYDVKGDYYFFDRELENIKLLSERYPKTILLLNIGGVMDLTALKDIEGLNSIVLMGQLGNLGGDAIWDVLTGKVNPSGKLVDTWAQSYLDYPSSEKFSHRESVHDEEYTDGIYVGYRYFDSFEKKVTYPFGYGLSYTSFEIEKAEVSISGKNVLVKTEVKNTGGVAGREVVQVYVSAPDGRLPKPYKELKGFGKTEIIEAGLSKTLEISFDAESMASYDEKLAAWVIEKGDYVVRVGNCSASARAVAIIKADEEIIVQRVKNVLPLDISLKEIQPDKKVSDSDLADLPVVILDKNAIKTIETVYQSKRAELKNTRSEKLTVEDILKGNCTIDEFVAQLTIEEMAQLCVGTYRQSGGEVVGNASQMVPGAAGDTSAVIREDRGLEAIILADGPAGLRLQPHFRTDKDGNLLKGGSSLGEPEENFETVEGAVDYYQYTTAIPIGWSIAMSWDMELAQKAGDMVGKEMEQFGVDLWLAPALNIHRNPLCGRNFEYYSE